MIPTSRESKKHPDLLTLITYGSMIIAVAALLYYSWEKWFHSILDTDGLSPHGYCFLWNPLLVLLHAGSDTLIGISYVTISITLVYFVARAHRDLPFHWIFIAFGAFIIACSFTHFLDVWTLWYATYWLSGTMKLITAVVSLTTAVVLPFMLPQANRLIIATKISNQRKIELEAAHKELEALYAKTKELNELKTNFFANVSHELRTPLTLILGSINNLPAKQQQSSEVKIIERNALSLLKHVNDLLDIAKLEAGQVYINYERVDLVQLLQSCLALFKGMIQERHITITINSPAALVSQVDREKLQRVFLNLISNALKYTPNGGAITCHLRTSSERIYVTVQDSGPGVPREQREAIFERFRQGENSLTRHTGGTGLGLAIVKEMVELHGGTVYVDDASSGGASFTLELPMPTSANMPTTSDDSDNITVADAATYRAAAEQLIAETTPYEAAPEPPGTAEHLPFEPPDQDSLSERPLILIIEDNSAIVRLIAHVLKDTYRVTTALDGQDGLAKAFELEPDLILCDVMMPVMNGARFIEVLRRQPNFVATPIIILSARADDELRVKLLHEGAQDYVMKPFSSAELLARIGNLLAMAHVRKVLQQDLHSRNQDIMALVEEITARKQALQEILEKLRKNEEYLQKVNKMQRNFIATASHEFRTTLTGIQGFSELLRDEMFDTDTVKEYATDINTDARRLTRMIDELLDLERIKSGKVLFSPKPLPINDLLTTVAQRTQASTAGHVIDLQLDRAQSQVFADEDKLTQVLTNLLSNAIKYSPAGGTVRLKSLREGEFVHISIQDQGIGIPADALNTIFEPYNRVEGETTQYIPGTGLGLAIVQQIVTMHGGRIWAESTPGKGSIFHFTIPVAVRERIPTAQSTSQS